MRTPQERAYPAHWEADVVLRDGGTALIRPITADDAGRLVEFYERVSDESKYYRFFAPYPRLSDRDVRRFTHHDYVDRVGLAATIGGEFIATVRYDRIDGDGRAAFSPAAGEDASASASDASGAGAVSAQAEVAFLVRDDQQGRGVASALLEHIAAVARERGIERFTAEVLPANSKMIKVFTDAGYSQHRSFEDGSVHLTFDLEPTERSLAVMSAREQRAEGRSVERLLAPGSVAVVGASRSPRGAGRRVLESLRAGGFTGGVYAVNRELPEEGGELGGVPAYRSVKDVPEHLDLVVVAVPAGQVHALARECGEAGVQGLVVLTADFGRDEQRELVRLARSYGTRVIGPNALGLMNTAPDVRLNATLSPEMPARGRAGLFTQSGAIGIALLAGLHQRGIGLSGFVSAGNRADVSGNDVLQHWDDDPDTDVALLYLESIGNPRKFTRLARRIAARKPVVVVKGARHSGSAPPAGHAAPVSRTPVATVTTLLRQAGVVMVDTVTELLDAGALLVSQPLPAGPRTAILGNAESLGLLSYDAALAGELRPQPVRDLGTSATPEEYRRALREALEDPETDAVVVTVIPWVGDTPATELADALREGSEGAEKPVTVVQLAIEGLETALAERGIPSYPAPERAVRALSEASRHARWRREAEHPGRVPEFEADEDAASALLHRASASAAGAAGAGVEAGPPVADESAPAGAGAPGTGAFDVEPDGESEAGASGSWPGPGSGTPGAGADAAAAASGSGSRSSGSDADVEVGAPAADESASAGAGAPGTGASGAGASAESGREPGPSGSEPGIPAVPPAGRREAQAATERARSVTLGADDAVSLLGFYGIAVQPTSPAPGPDEAAAAARRLGYPVALKTTAPHLRHRADLGGVRLDISSETELRRAYAELTDSFGDAGELRPVVQAMAPRGVDTVVRAAVDPTIGAVLSFGLAGTPSELLEDVAHRLVPVTDKDAAELVRAIRSAPILFGWRGAQPVDVASLEDLLLRVSRLLHDHPEIVAVDLEPVVVAPRGRTVLGATVRVAEPPPQTDLGRRSLPAY
ncbi:GNAT family N-acetyltransferase [Streptomyces sp. HNM0575]|uniref:bifunctional acetate--CoA ligase family protein/GNAT family N-acetyltransferase n=1 Tax=Streptomyces sp. HNM0575 TaxID=2716338 RepID=UPI00145D562E|nr:GNAT family N-acetyltransferase [Streptomyces sp. HNM0575]NLU73806.1 GNAT family N-acetyltransferase [Streptomyces sp. HNM0575]